MHTATVKLCSFYRAACILCCELE